MATIEDFYTGDLITDGLQGSTVCDEALQIAKEIAERRDTPVLLGDDDGESWIVYPNREYEEE